MIDERLLRFRSQLVQKYRADKRPWPDGIDSKWDRWYRPEEWTDKGEYIGPSGSNAPLESNAIVSNDPQSNAPLESNAEFDKGAYQRERMRWQRYRDKAKKGGSEFLSWDDWRKAKLKELAT
jgi:hypothetical protein